MANEGGQIDKMRRKLQVPQKRLEISCRCQLQVPVAVAGAAKEARNQPYIH